MDHHHHITQILLPALHQHHWSVYYVNFDQSRIDVLDSRDYSPQGDNSWDMYHSIMGKTIMQCLSDALSKAAPHKSPSFMNWRHLQVEVSLQKCPTDDPFFAMKFLEFSYKTLFDLVNTTVTIEAMNLMVKAIVTAIVKVVY